MKHRQAVIALLILILIFTTVFTTLLHMRYKAFFSHDWRDEAVDNQIIYNSAHFDLVYSTIKGPMIFHRHFRPIFIVCAIPWLIHDEILTWFITVGLVLGLGSLAIFSFARKRLRSVNLAFGFAAAYLIWQPLHEVALGNYDPETLVATFWLFAALAFDDEKPGWFWFWTVMALICKETMAVVLFGFGILALLQRRKFTWWAIPLVVAPVWFFACIELIIPIYHPTFDTIYGRFIGCEVGGFPLCFFAALFSAPSATLGTVFSREHMILFWGMLRAYGPLSLLGIEWLIPAMPVALEILLLKDPHPVRQAHIISSMIPFVFLAGIVGAARLSDFLEKQTKGRISFKTCGSVILGIFVLICVVLFFKPGVFGKWQNYGRDPLKGFQPSNVFSPEFYRYTDEHERAWQTIALIGKTAPAMTNNRFLLALSSRPELREFGTQTKLEDYDDSEYVLVSLIQPPCRTCTYNPLNADNLDQLKQLVKKGRFKVARAFADHVLLIRWDVSGPTLGDKGTEEFFTYVDDAAKRVSDHKM